MKKTIFFITLSLFSSLLMAQEEGWRGSRKSIILVKEYAEHLNALSQANTAQKNDSSLNESLILREGKPGDYFYSAVPGKEDVALRDISTFDIACYVLWKEEKEHIDFYYSLGSFESIDPLLKINHPIMIFFEDDLIQEASGAAPITFEKEIASSVILLGSILGGGSQRETPELTLTEEQQAHIREGLQRHIDREDLSRRTRYKGVDELWQEREATWGRQKNAYQQLQEKNQELLLAQEKLKEATEAHANLEETQLGKFQQQVENLAQVLHYVPEPHTQLVATAMDLTASTVHWAKQIWSSANHHQAEQHEKRTKGEVEQAEKELHHASAQSVLLERQADHSEEETSNKEYLKTKELACSLRPQGGWWHHEWELWSKGFLEEGSFSHEEEKKTFIQQARENLPWITEQTASLWQKRLHQSQEEVERITQESKKSLAPLKQLHQQAEKVLEAKVATTQKAYQLFQRAQESHKELKHSMEVFLKTQGDEWNQEKINKQRQTFCDQFGQLIQNHKNITQMEQYWKKALEEEQLQKLHTFEMSQHFEATREKYDRLTKRAKKALQADQEQFQKVWPEFDLSYRPYLEWQLPFDLEQEPSLPLEFHDVVLKERASLEAPLEPMEEVEARGRRLLYQGRAAIREALLPKKEAVSSKSSSSETSPISSERTQTDVSSETTTTPEESLLTWSGEQANNPTPREIERWHARAELEHCRQESNRLAKLLQQESQEQQEAGTLFSFKTTNTKKALSRLSYFTTRTSKSSATVKSTTAEEEKNPQEQFQQALLAEEVAQKRWFGLVEKAEEERLARGEKAFITEEAKIDTWAFADQQALKKLNNRKGVLEEKKAAQTLESSWPSNNKRWQARVHADRAEKTFQECQQELARFFQRKDLKESERLQQKKELEGKIREATKQAKETQALWQELAQAHEGIQQGKITLAELAAFDQGVLKRWHQFQENQGPLDPEKAALLEEQPSYELTLGLQLEEEEKKAFEKVSTFEAGIDHYQQAVTQEALRSAQENIPRAAQTWKERVNRGQKQLEEWENQLANPQASRQEVTRLEKLLPQLRGVVKADQKAAAIFEKEERRLGRIEKLWHSIALAKKEKQLERAQKAAVSFHQGDHAAWSGLTEEERHHYNSMIADKNQQYHQMLASEEQFLIEVKNSLEAEQKRSTQFLSWIRGAMTGKQQAALDFLKQAQEYYQGRFHAFNERKEVICFEKMTPEEQEQHLLNERYRLWLNQDPELAKEATEHQQIDSRAREAYHQSIEVKKKHERHSACLCVTLYRDALGTQTIRYLNQEVPFPLAVASRAYENAAKAYQVNNIEIASHSFKIAQRCEEIVEAFYRLAEDVYNHAKILDKNWIKNNQKPNSFYNPNGFGNWYYSFESEPKIYKKGSSLAVDLFQKRFNYLRFATTNYAASYKENSSEERNRRFQRAQNLEQAAEAVHQQMNALSRKDPIIAKLYEKRTDKFDDAASLRSDEMRTDSTSLRMKTERLAKLAEQIADIILQQIEALARGDYDAAERHMLQAEQLWR